MRDKLKGMVEQEAIDHGRRQNAINKLQAAVATRREQLSSININSNSNSHTKDYIKPVMNPSKQDLVRELQDDEYDHQLMKKWPQIVAAKALAINRESLQMQDSITTMETIIARYQTHFGLQVPKQPIDGRSNDAETVHLPMETDENGTTASTEVM